MIKRTIVSLMTLVAVAAFLIADTTPLIEFKFNDLDGNQTLANTGSLSDVTGTFRGAGGFYQNLTPGNTDYPPVNSITTWVARNPSTPTGNGFATTSAVSGLNNLTSFTVCGWFNHSNGHSNGRLVSNADGSTAGIDIFTLALTQVTLRVDGIMADAGCSTIWPLSPAEDRWMFIAVTYDGTAASNNVQYYVGDGETLTLSNTASLNAGAVGVSTKSLWIYNYPDTPTTERNLVGLYDDVRIYGTTSGTTGVISQEELTTVMKTNDIAIPEPCTFIMLIFGCGLFGISKKCS